MKGSITFLSFIIIVGLFIGFAIRLFLLLNKSSKNRSNVYLALSVFCAVAFLLCPFFYLIGWDDGVSIFFRFGRITGFILGPSVYFYVRSSLHKDFKMLPIHWLSFLPALLDFVFFHIPLLMINSDLKIEYFSQFIETGIFRNKGDYQLVSILKVLHSIFYGIISLRIILQYRKHLTETTSFIDSSYHRWLLIFCSFLIYPFFILFVFVFSTGENINLGAFYFGFVFYIVSVFVSTLLKPELFYIFPHQMLLPDSPEEKHLKYENSNLKEENKEMYLKKLLDHFEQESPYLSPDLTLANVAEHTKISSNYLSQVINEKLNCTFLDFVNSYRVETAKKLLSEDANKNFTILSIAYDAGFNSKSTFYSAFKKHVGTTPSGYRKTLVAN